MSAVMTAEESADAWLPYYEALKSVAVRMSPEYRRTVEGPPDDLRDAVERQMNGQKYPETGKQWTVNRPADKVLAMATVAGHTFEGVGSDARCGCGKYRDDLRGRTREWIGTHGHAHVGELTEHEYNQIEEMWARDGAIWEAVEGVAGGR